MSDSNAIEGKLTAEELARLLELFKDMHNSPVLTMTGKPEDSFHIIAQKRVIDYMDELGKKYKVDLASQNYGIDPKTGEIKKVR